MKRYSAVSVGILLFLSGCVATTRYDWGEYEKTLYSYYKHPEDVETFTQELISIIENGEEEGKVPPGIYAEYGYVLYLSSKPLEAIHYYEKEKEQWSESAVFMDKMINLAKLDSESETPSTPDESQASMPASMPGESPATTLNETQESTSDDSHDGGDEE